MTARWGLVKIAALYWAVLGLAMLLYLAIDREAFSANVPIVAGTVVGAACGQALAIARIRGWLAMLIVLAIGIVFVPYDEVLWLSCLAAALSGYWSLGDRTSLAAFWYPSVLWMLPILDGVDANALLDRNGLLLLAALALLFVLFLRVREQRRIALWTSVATVTLATPRAPVILRDGSRRDVARAGWAVTITALCVAVTGYLAPRLWRWHASLAEQATDAYAAAAGSTGLACCPAADAVVHVHAKEFFDVRGVAHGHAPQPGVECRVCPIATGASTGGSGVMVGDAVDGAQVAPTLEPALPAPVTSSAPTGSMVALAPTPTPATSSATPAPIAVTVPLAALSPPPPPAPVEVPAAPVPAPAPPPLPAAMPVSPGVPITTGNSPQTSNTSQRPPGIDILTLVIALATALASLRVVTLLLRPLRRLVTLRHLRRPLWPETVDQRVSNSWQLALVGLRDAGWRASPDEGAREFARRVRIDAAQRCATILERARHGIALDHDDLVSMDVEAELVYRAARARIGAVARAATWLRWPLVD